MADKQTQFDELVKDIKKHKCSLSAGCIQAVPGEGNIESEVIFIGEGPGKTEDELGRPFVGAAGKVLDEGLQRMGWQRKDVYITNVVKCRPPGNRDPSVAEVKEHKPFLEKELAIIEPKLIVLLGRHALQWFLPGEKISAMRGTAKRRGEKVFYATYHPAAALYDPRLKETLFSDLKKIPVILKKIDEAKSSSSNIQDSQAMLF